MAEPNYEAPSRELVVRRLLELAAELGEAERAVYAARVRVDAAEDHLRGLEDRLLLNDGVAGKNEQIRAAHLREQTLGLRIDLANRERELAAHQVRLRTLQHAFAAWRSVAALLAAPAGEVSGDEKSAAA